MTKFFCDYCQVYLTHDSQGGRKQHNRGRKHQDAVKAYYMNFLRSHVRVDDDRTMLFVPVPLNADGTPQCEGALPGGIGDKASTSMTLNGPLSSIGIGIGGAKAAIVLGSDVPLLQPSALGPIRTSGEVLKGEDAVAYVNQMIASLTNQPLQLPPPPPQQAKHIEPMISSNGVITLPPLSVQPLSMLKEPMVKLEPGTRSLPMPLPPPPPMVKIEHPSMPRPPMPIRFVGQQHHG